MKERRTQNENLEAPPDDLALLRALLALEERPEMRFVGGASAQDVAWKCGVTSARRLGRGAQGPQSWSGYMAPALRVAPRLRSLVKRGLIYATYDLEKHRRYYSLTRDGRAIAEAT